eukprot:360216-Pelagomonas_calceolata.AAC.3
MPCVTVHASRHTYHELLPQLLRRVAVAAVAAAAPAAAAAAHASTSPARPGSWRHWTAQSSDRTGPARRDGVRQCLRGAADPRSQQRKAVCIKSPLSLDHV